MVDEVENPAFRLILDVKAMCSEQRPFPAIIAEQASRLAYFHANDCNRREPGSGDVDFAPILAALRAAGYDGWASIEVFDYKPDPVTIARRGLATLRRALDEAAPAAAGGGA